MILDRRAEPEAEAEDGYNLRNGPFIVRGFQGVRGEPTEADEVDWTV